MMLVAATIPATITIRPAVAKTVANTIHPTKVSFAECGKAAVGPKHDDRGSSHEQGKYGGQSSKDPIHRHEAPKVLFTDAIRLSVKFGQIRANVWNSLHLAYWDGQIKRTGRRAILRVIVIPQLSAVLWRTLWGGWAAKMPADQKLSTRAAVQHHHPRPWASGPTRVFSIIPPKILIDFGTSLTHELRYPCE